MSVQFVKKEDDYAAFYIARLESPTGGVYEIDPFADGCQMEVSHQTKGGRNGFGLSIRSGKHQKVLHVGTCGETESFLRLIKRELKPWFWAQE